MHISAVSQCRTDLTVDPARTRLFRAHARRHRSVQDPLQQRFPAPYRPKQTISAHTDSDDRRVISLWNTPNDRKGEGAGSRGAIWIRVAA